MKNYQILLLLAFIFGAGCSDRALKTKAGKMPVLSVKVDKTLVSPISEGVEWIDTSSHGDSKLLEYKNDIYTLATNDFLLIKKINQEFKPFSPAIHANWFNMDMISADRMAVISGSFAQRNIEFHEIDLATGKTKYLSTIANEGGLLIDPTILRTDKGYYATFTEITGTINRGNPALENGNYKVELYFSSDLKEWKHINTILDRKSNLEDGVLFFDKEEILHFIYEEEELDMGHSKIKIITSTNLGQDWSEPKVVIGDAADHEPAEIIQKNSLYYFFYSNDLDNGGVGSYDQAKMKYAILDDHFNVLTKNIDITGNNSESLYDVVYKKDQLYFLYTKNYSTENQLVLSKGKNKIIK